MLDSDLAELYGYETKNLNKQVKRNIDRFPKDFMFQLNETEVNHLRFQNGTSNSHGGTRYLPYAFTEQGVYMLATVLKSDIAIQQSILIMRTFKEMRHYLANNKYHDRYMILDYGTNDEVIYHCGASSKDAGNKITAMNRIRQIEAYKDIIKNLLLNPILKLK